jgi:hypothetical protein
MDRTVGVEERLTEGRIAELGRLLGEIRSQTQAYKQDLPNHQQNLRPLFGMLIGMCWSHPEAIARYLWRTNETDKGTLHGS